MKRYWQYALLAVLAIFISPIALPALANFERYPTNTEVERLRGKFIRNINELKKDKWRANIIKDSRTSSEKNKRQALVKTWRNRNRSIAKFLGNWSEFETSMHIYPTKTKGRVCLVYVGNGQGSFELGRVVGNKLRNARGGKLFLEKNYLGLGYISGGRPSLSQFPFHSPRPLMSINKLTSWMTEASEKEKSLVIRDFKKYRCFNP